MKFNLILYGKNEFFPNLNNKIYHILVVNNEESMNFMNKKFIEFNNENSIIGLDFEFRKITKSTREIALTQINLENNEENAYIFIFYPPAINNLDIFIKLICNKEIIKVLHGGESLDIPYIFNNLLNNDENLIKKFIKNLYDTKFLCEYYHQINNINKKCSIYNLLEEFKIIDKKNINKLENIEKEIGKIYLVKFDINNLSNPLINYALYDVIYLPTLINKFIKKSKINKIISDFTGIIYYLKKTNKIEQLYFDINKFNNYNVDDNINLIDIFNYYYLNYSNNLLCKLSNITYFKQFIKIIIKYCIYKNVTKKYKIELLFPNLNDYLLNNKNLIKLINNHLNK